MTVSDNFTSRRSAARRSLLFVWATALSALFALSGCQVLEEPVFAGTACSNRGKSFECRTGLPGACAAGTNTCLSSGTWSGCVPEPNCAGFKDCDGDGTLETDLSNTRSACGACDNSCGYACSSGQCAEPMSLSLGESHACVALSDGTVSCWGEARDGRRGISPMPDGQPLPTSLALAVPEVAGAAQIKAGRKHTCARLGVELGEGAVLCWGANQYEQLGDLQASGGTSHADTEVFPVLTIKDGVTDVAVGKYHSCALANTGKVSCWGDNYGSQCTGSLLDAFAIGEPEEVDNLAQLARDVEVGHEHSCAIGDDRYVYCWGQNLLGQSGFGAPGGRGFGDAPVLKANGAHLASVAQLALGADHSCALVGGGFVYCWGDNAHGQLGTDSTSTVASGFAVKVAGLDNVTSVAAGGNTTCALLDSGEVRCWGEGTAGQLGQGANESSDSPVAVSGLSDAIDVQVGIDFTCAQRANRTIECWGNNDEGQLGFIGDSTNKPSGVIVDPTAFAVL